jgi:Fic family protein
MRWNWQQPEWPSFVWDGARLAKAEDRFLLGGGVLVGATKHLGDEDKDRVIVEAMCSEALTTSEIEGEILDKSSVQSSIQKQLGLAPDNTRVRPAEQGIAEMVVDVYHTYQAPLTDKALFTWHAMVTRGRRDLTDIGCYRRGEEPMQVVSRLMGEPRIHFEAPPSSNVGREMERFIAWFNETGPNGGRPLPALTRAGTAHIYFESIHPFEDGNGRVGRAIAEKAMAQGLGQPSLTALAATIAARRNEYYGALERANKRVDISDWLAWFAGIALEAQQRTIALAEFVIDKTRLLDKLSGLLNERQNKALLRVFREGPNGFKGGLTASKYAAITGASPATTTRDLVDLVDKGAIVRQGEHRHARYYPKISQRSIPRVVIDNDGSVVLQDESPRAPNAVPDYRRHVLR